MIRTKEQAKEALKKTADDEAFYFCNEKGFLNIKANSIEEALEKIKNIDESSINYHLKNGHFQKWIVDIFRDDALSRKVDRLSKKESIKKEDLVNVLEERIRWLKSKVY